MNNLHVHRRWLAIVLAVATVSPAALADHPKPAAGVDEPLAPLLDNLGNHEHKVTTNSALAQKYFNQGLRLIYAFNHDEAIRAFRSAAKIDPNCAMAQWGISVALGPNYNLPVDEERAKSAFAALQKAQELSARASDREQAYIEALSHRYVADPLAERKPLDEAYAAAMGTVAERFPDDLDAATIYAESLMNLRPWKLWTFDGKPEPGTETILKTLERVLAENPNHPGANHYYIHAVEWAMPEKGVPAADRLGALMPGAGHMVHMPAHIYFRVGRYRDSSASNQAAIKADEAYIARCKPEGVYPMMYYPHNIHFLWASLTMEGRGAEAILAAEEVVQKVPAAMVKEMPMLEAFPPTRLFALVRFGKWDEVLKEPAPDAEFTYVAGIRHYARGLAWAAHGQLDEAKKAADELHNIAALMPEEKMAMQHHARDLLTIAANHLDATLLADTGKIDEAVEKLRESVKQQDALRYDEPPPWYLPMRQPLGALLLKANRPADAESAYREDLKYYPENGWSLAGLERALRAQNKTDEADKIHQRFEKAWPNADVDPL